MNRRLLMTAAIVLAGCTPASMSARARSVQVTDAAHVTGCKPLGQVSGSSGAGGLLVPAGMSEAKAKALDSAGALGATHLVWLDPTVGGEVQIASGLAYRCE